MVVQLRLEVHLLMVVVSLFVVVEVEVVLASPLVVGFGYFGIAFDILGWGLI